MSDKPNQLVQAGETLFIKYGMRRVTVDEICRQAGVSKPTFYKHFKNKDALARRIIEIWIEEALKKIEEIEESNLTFPEKMKQILAVKQELSFHPGPEFLKDLIDLNIDLSHAFRRVLRFFVKSQQDGDIRGDIHPEFLMAAISALNNLQYDPGVRSLYKDSMTLPGDVFKLFYYGALSSEHSEAGLPDIKPAQ